MLKKIWAPSIASLLCGLFVLSGGGLVFSNQTPKLAGDETVIVKSSERVAGEQIGSTDYYVVTADEARQIRQADDATETHAVQLYAKTTTNDPFEPQTYLSVINASDAWNITTGSSDVTVAVIDSGFALEHEDLAGRWYINEAEYGPTDTEGAAPNCTSRSLPLDKSCNNIDDSGNGFVDDWRGWDIVNGDNDPSAGSTNPNGDAVHHGTAVSGMVGATGNNGVGVASINWGAKILPVQVIDDDGFATTVELAQALAYAIDMEVDVINLSLGTGSLDSVIEGLLEDAWEAGIVVVAAAGNCGGSSYALNGCSFQGQMLYPATSQYTISVVATDTSDNRASFSSQGTMADIAAPGTGSIRTTLYDSDDTSGAYSASISGTSFSAPIVSGMAASILGLWPDASPRDVRAMIVDTPLKISEMGSAVHTNQHGFGRIRPSNALNLTQQCATPADPEDINCDGSVGLLDLSILAAQWQVNRTGRSDINGLGKTDLLDLSLLASKWGQ